MDIHKFNTIIDNYTYILHRHPITDLSKYSDDYQDPMAARARPVRLHSPFLLQMRGVGGGPPCRGALYRHALYIHIYICVGLSICI